MSALYIVTIVALIVSVLFNRQKTKQGLLRAWKKFKKILPNYIKILILVSIILLLSEDFIINYLGSTSLWLGLISALLLGSITMMPGFIAYPLAGILVSRGVSYMVVAGFVTTLMMVGIMTYPVEKEYYGPKATIIRNGVSFLIAAIISIGIGIYYGEVAF
ncbi:MAG: hypothetical protein ACQEP9_06230 [Bacillota bacterium]